MKSFIELKKLAKRCKNDKNSMKVALLGNCATQHLKTAVIGMAIERKINVEVWEADYNQVYAQIMDNSSELYVFNPEIVILYLCSERLQEEYYLLDEKGKFNYPEFIVSNLRNYWDTLNNRTSVKIIQFNFTEIDDRVFGNYANKVEKSFLWCIRKIQYLLLEQAYLYKNVYIMDLNYIQSILGRNVLFDEKMYYLAKMPLSLQVLPIVADNILSIISSIKGVIKKCVVCDLDNTLWGGTVAEDGVQGINIGELGIGRAFSDFQQWLKQLKERGIILAICSKNDEKIAKEVFERNPDLILSLDDIAVFIANWEDKASNIKYIQSILNIGFDSMVFLDDNIFERNLVRTMIPHITVPELPEDPALYLTYLQGLNLFETASLSSEDETRTLQYKNEIKRQEMVNNYLTYDEYLKDLNMIATTGAFDEFHYPRIAQLTQRSNQFNLRTVRYTEKEIEQISKNDKFITCYVELKDRFGNHGLISAVILEEIDAQKLFINTWIMSCRVLKRGVEEFVINKIVELAMNAEYQEVIGQYIPTTKNSMVKDLYLKMGFNKFGENKYTISVTDYKKNKTEIKEN